MKAFFKIILLFCFFSLSCSLNAAAQDKFSADAEELLEELEFLCDSTLAGRAFGSPENNLLSFYLLRQFRSEGLRTTVQSFESAGKVGHNIVAVTPGYFKTYIVVSAYYDGLGTLDGAFYPGADSNASGVAALIHLGRNMPALCRGSVGLIFVAFDGHNASMSGAKSFLDKYRKEYKIERIVNLDTMGSDLVPLDEDRPEYIMALGAQSLFMSLDRANRDLGMDIGYDYYGSSAFTDLFYRKISDQRCFIEAGIPAVMFTSGITMNTNKTTDTVDNLNLGLFAKRVSLIGRWLQAIL